MVLEGAEDTMNINNTKSGNKCWHPVNWPMHLDSSKLLASWWAPGNLPLSPAAPTARQQQEKTEGQSATLLAQGQHLCASCLLQESGSICARLQLPRLEGSPQSTSHLQAKPDSNFMVTKLPAHSKHCKICKDFRFAVINTFFVLIFPKCSIVQIYVWPSIENHCNSLPELTMELKHMKAESLKRLMRIICQYVGKDNLVLWDIL